MVNFALKGHLRAAVLGRIRASLQHCIHYCSDSNIQIFYDAIFSNKDQGVVNLFKYLEIKRQGCLESNILEC